MIQISGSLKGELEIKRFYLEGVTIKIKCPKCNYKYNNNQYLSYPEVNKIIDFDCYCPNCDHEWSEKIKINVTLGVITQVEDKHGDS